MHGSIFKESVPNASTKWNERLDDGEILPDKKVIVDVSGTQNKNTELPTSGQKEKKVITPTTLVNVSSTEPVIFARHGEEYENALSKCKFYPTSNVMVSWKVISEVVILVCSEGKKYRKF